MKQPKISIITVCYNSKKTVLRTMQSVIEQKYQNLEYIVIDGGSVDGTKELISSFKQKTGFPNIFISEKDNGIYDAMNKGIKNATGDLICMLNSDDWLERDVLNTIADNYDGQEYIVIYGMERRMKNDKEESVGFHSHNFIEEGNIPHQTCYITRKCYEKYGLYDIKYRSAADYDLILRLFNNDVEFKPIYKVLANFSVGGMSAGATGYIEEARIKLANKIITRKKYYYLVLRARFLKLIGQIK